MILDVANQLFQLAQGLLIPIPLENNLSRLYVVLDLLIKVLFAGADPEGGFFDFLPF